MRPVLLAVLVVLLVFFSGCSGPVITPPAPQVPGTGQTPAPTVSGIPPSTTNLSFQPGGGSQAGPAAGFTPVPGATPVLTTTISPGGVTGGSGVTIISGTAVTAAGPTVPSTLAGAPFGPQSQVSIPVPLPPPVTGTVSSPVVPTPGTPLVTPSSSLPQPSPQATIPTTLVTPPLPNTTPLTTIPTPRAT
jgi:hypothetical protein